MKMLDEGDDATDGFDDDAHRIMKYKNCTAIWCFEIWYALVWL
jgi:hypothetical protein